MKFRFLLFLCLATPAFGKGPYKPCYGAHGYLEPTVFLSGIPEVAMKRPVVVKVDYLSRRDIGEFLLGQVKVIEVIKGEGSKEGQVKVGQVFEVEMKIRPCILGHSVWPLPQLGYWYLSGELGKDGLFRGNWTSFELRGNDPGPIKMYRLPDAHFDYKTQAPNARPPIEGPRTLTPPKTNLPPNYQK